VVRARGTDAGFQGGSGTLMIAQTQTLGVPFYTSGRTTMTFA
jgi:hypothetical protein